jgi:hypothetical protein
MVHVVPVVQYEMSIARSVRRATACVSVDIKQWQGSLWAGLHSCWGHPVMHEQWQNGATVASIRLGGSRGTHKGEAERCGWGQMVRSLARGARLFILRTSLVRVCMTPSMRPKGWSWQGESDTFWGRLDHWGLFVFGPSLGLWWDYEGANMLLEATHYYCLFEETLHLYEVQFWQFFEFVLSLMIRLPHSVDQRLNLYYPWWLDLILIVMWCLYELVVTFI